MNQIKCASILLSVGLLISSPQLLAKAQEETEIKGPVTPSQAGVVPENIDSATPGLMPIKPLKDIPENVLAILDALPEKKSEFIKVVNATLY